MSEEFKEELPGELVVSLKEVMRVVAALERHLDHLSELGDAVGLENVDAVIGRITRWVRPLLRELDEEDGRYDD